MPRGVPSEKKRREKLLADAQAWLGAEVKLSDETTDDKVAEAQAVLNYVEAPQNFKEKICKWCGMPFLYRWNRDAIAYCSIQHMADALRAKGLVWDPLKTPQQRWGRVLPEVISGSAVSVLRYGSSEAQADPLQYTLF